MKNVYIILSQTRTKFGWAIRRVGKVKYNHTAIALDDDFTEWYSFARKHHSAVLTGGVVKENIQRYTLKKDGAVQSAVFCIKLTDKKYEKIKKNIEKIYSDNEYIYNLLSVITYPVFQGFKTYKAFTCAEFVAYLLDSAGVGGMFKEEFYKYTPDDIGKFLNDYLVFEGDLRDYVMNKDRNDMVTAEYFKHFSRVDLRESVVNLYRMFARLFYRV